MVKRVKEIAYMRAFAALSIIMIHSTSGYINASFWGSALNQFPRFGSPLFVMMSGFILYHIELKRPSVSYYQFFKHRFLKVAIPYFIWTLFYTTFSLRTEIFGDSVMYLIPTVKLYLINLLTGTGYVHLYFILIMIQLYALFPFLKKAMDNYTITTMTVATSISFVFQMLIYIHRLGIITLPDLGIAYATLFPGWLVFFCFGIYLKMRLEPSVSFWQTKKFACALIWIGLMVIAMYEVRISPVNISLRPVISLYGLSTFFLFYLIFERMKKIVSPKVDSLIEWVANNSFDIYLVHPLVLNLLVMVYHWSGYAGALGLYIFAVLFTCFIIYIMKTVKHYLRIVPLKEKGQLLNSK